MIRAQDRLFKNLAAWIKAETGVGKNIILYKYTFIGIYVKISIYNISGLYLHFK